MFDHEDEITALQQHLMLEKEKEQQRMKQIPQTFKPEGWAKVDIPAPKYLEPGWRTNNKGPNPENKSGFRATGHRILLVPEAVEKKTAGGLILPEKTVFAEEQRAVIATVLEIGPDAWRDKSTDYCELGDRVLIGQYVGKFHTSPIDGKVYRFVSDLDIISPLPKVE